MTQNTRESTLGRIAYAAYLHGRIVGVLPPASPLREKLANRYAAPSRQPVEPYTFLLGIRDAGCPLSSPDDLLETVWCELQMPEPRRRPRRVDTRWGARR